MIKVQFDLRDATDEEKIIARRLIEHLENSVSVEILKVSIIKMHSTGEELTRDEIIAVYSDAFIYQGKVFALLK